MHRAEADFASDCTVDRSNSFGRSSRDILAIDVVCAQRQY